METNAKMPYQNPGADPGFLKRGGVQISKTQSTSKKGGPDGGPILGPMLNSLHRGTKGGGSRPPGPPPPPLGPHLEPHNNFKGRLTVPVLVGLFFQFLIHQHLNRGRPCSFLQIGIQFRLSL